MSDSETSSPNSDKKRNVGNETPFGLCAHGNGIKLALMSISSCSKGMVLPLVPDNLKDRNAVLGFLFDVAVQRNYYDNMGLESVVTEEDIYEKDSIVWRAARMAQCGARGGGSYASEQPQERWPSSLALALTILHIIPTASPLSMG